MWGMNIGWHVFAIDFTVTFKVFQKIAIIFGTFYYL